MGVKRRRKELPLSQKIWLAKLRKDNGLNFQQCREALWNRFSLNPEDWRLPDSTLTSFLGKRNIDQWASKTILPDTDNSIRIREGQHPKLEQALHLWFTQELRTDDEKAGVTDAVWRERAQILGAQLDLSDFKFSPGWLHRFKQRHGIKPRRPSQRAQATSTVDTTTTIFNPLADDEVLNLVMSLPAKKRKRSEEKPVPQMSRRTCEAMLSDLIAHFEKCPEYVSDSISLECAACLKKVLDIIKVAEEEIDSQPPEPGDETTS